MAYDVLKREQVPGDWTMGDEPDTSVPFITAASDANRIVDKAVREEQQAVEEMSAAQKTGGVSDANWRSFKEYHDGFHKWLASTGKRPYGSMKLGTHGIYTTAFEHRKQIKDWRDLAYAAGATHVGPKARGIDQKEPDKGTSVWAWVAAALGGAATVMIVQHKLGG